MGIHPEAKNGNSTFEGHERTHKILREELLYLASSYTFLLLQYTFITVPVLKYIAWTQIIYIILLILLV